MKTKKNYIGKQNKPASSPISVGTWRLTPVFVFYIFTCF